MKTKLIALLLLISVSSISQISFQKGYYINNNKIEGFIKNYDWKNNPTSFEFKKNLETNYETIDIALSKEFGIDTKVAFVKSEVAIERSSEKTANIGYTKDPIFTTETLFLKLLVTGKNKLYYYYNEGIEKFFYSSENKPIKQLIFIKYKIDRNDVKYKEEYKNFEPNTVLFNDYYKKQLWLDVRCPETLATEPSIVKYNSTDLKKYFTKINNCNGSTEKIEFEVKKTIFSLKAVALVNKSKISYKNLGFNNAFDENINVGIGADLEFLFPFNNYKWSLFLEPSYNSYKEKMEVTSTTVGFNTMTQNVEINMNYIQVPFGLRYYFDINNNSKIFLGTGININYVSNSKVDFERSSDLYVSQFTYNFIFSTGYKYKRISAELRYHSKTNLVLNYNGNIDFSRFNLALKYEVFKK